MKTLQKKRKRGGRGGGSLRCPTESKKKKIHRLANLVREGEKKKREGRGMVRSATISKGKKRKKKNKRAEGKKGKFISLI